MTQPTEIPIITLATVPTIDVHMAVQKNYEDMPPELTPYTQTFRAGMVEMIKHHFNEAAGAMRKMPSVILEMVEKEHTWGALQRLNNIVDLLGEVVQWLELVTEFERFADQLMYHVSPKFQKPFISKLAMLQNNLRCLQEYMVAHPIPEETNDARS